MNSERPTPAEYQILLALADAERHGYAIMQEIERRSVGAWRLGPATLYRSLKQMATAGWITEAETLPQNDDPRRGGSYRLTEAGRAVAAAQARDYADLAWDAVEKGLVTFRLVPTEA